jgi:UDP-N-acetylglucosamine 2-epimerase (hydrolysing)
MNRRVLFVSGTRADFSKLRPLMEAVSRETQHSVSVFVTGMHMLHEYGSTHREVDSGMWDSYKFVNQIVGEQDFSILAKTLHGLGDYVSNFAPDLIVVHGDRLEALAGALVGVATNTLVAHVEGGELSGTVDESYRHAISKLSHLHFVANKDALSTLLQLGEKPSSIFVIGSPELDLMHSKELPSLDQVLERYQINFRDYGIAIFHPVVTELNSLVQQASEFTEALIRSGLNWVVIESNNDRGSAGIRSLLNGLAGPKFRVLPSMRFPFFLTLLRASQICVGNSSTGVREAPHYGVPSVNVGSRQNRRTTSPMVTNSGHHVSEILNAIQIALSKERLPDRRFGDGRSAARFSQILNQESTFQLPIQKAFERANTNLETP